jgi:hypothetical protein
VSLWLKTTNQRTQKASQVSTRGFSQAKARHIIAQELKRLGWKAEDLRNRRKGDPEKVKLVRRLRAETTMTLAWV